ncbi:MAG: hypothetical protein IT428_12855 [Planctomycetaceae bacterium]|nr:hypothetical protein [Planctomycetaceae bacterium]
MNPGILLGAGFIAISCATLFFARHRRLFLRTFVPPDELRAAVRAMPRGIDFARGMRLRGLLQATIGLLLLVIAAFWR